MSRMFQVFADTLQAVRMHWQEANFATFAVNAEVHHTAPRLQITDCERAQFCATQTMKKQNGENGAITKPFESVRCGCFKQGFRLSIPQRRRFAFVRALIGTFHSISRIERNGIALAQVIKQ